MYRSPFICHLLCPNIMITTTYTAQRREVGSSRNLLKSLSANRSQPTAHGQDGSLMKSIVLPVSQIVQFDLNHWFKSWFKSPEKNHRFLIFIKILININMKSQRLGVIGVYLAKCGNKSDRWSHIFSIQSGDHWANVWVHWACGV